MNDPPTELLGAKLRNAGWIEMAVWDNRGLCRMSWTDLGRRRGMLLRHIIETWDFASAGTLKEFSQNPTGPVAVFGDCSRNVAKAFWNSCLEELSLGPDDPALGTLVSLISDENLLPRLTFASLELAIVDWDAHIQGDDRGKGQKVRIM